MLQRKTGEHEGNNEQLKVESELKRVRRDMQLEKEKSRDISSKLVKTELDLEKANRWTQDSQILSNLTSCKHNITTGLGFD